MSDIGTIRRCPDCGEDYKIGEVNVMGIPYLAMRCKKCTNTPEERMFWGFKWLLTFRERTSSVSALD